MTKYRLDRIRWYRPEQSEMDAAAWKSLAAWTFWSFQPATAGEIEHAIHLGQLDPNAHYIMASDAPTPPR